MATDRQIAANRANAQRSTGPRTALGKMKSSRNALRHGLSLPLPADLANAANIDAIARRLLPRPFDAEQWASANAFALAHLEIFRIRAVRTETWLGTDLAQDNLKLSRLVALDRYERHARTRRRRAARDLEPER